jgi:hypothetical protein
LVPAHFMVCSLILSRPLTLFACPMMLRMEKLPSTTDHIVIPFVFKLILLLMFLVMFDYSYYLFKKYHIFYYDLFYHQRKLKHSLWFCIFEIIFWIKLITNVTQKINDDNNLRTEWLLYKVGLITRLYSMIIA